VRTTRFWNNLHQVRSKGNIYRDQNNKEQMSMRRTQ